MSVLKARSSVASASSRALAELVDQLTARLKAGNELVDEAVIAEHPEHAEELRRLLPALKMLSALSEPAPGERSPATAPGILGDFRLVREVGRGGMGVVYEAEQISLGRRVALKVLPFAATMDARQLQRFQNEVRAAASLQHPHIVPVYAVGCERGVHYYSMQFIDGYSVEAVIRRMQSEPSSKANRDRAVAWGIQAATALEHAHSVGIVHRDIKPANLLIDSHGQLWVTDFGLAHTATNPGLTMTGDVVGTLRYMSPEQAAAKHGLVDHRTDVYALGATLYELLTLRPAVAGTDREEILRNLTLEEPKKLRRLNRAIPTDLETIVLKALANDPAQRYSSAQHLADDLERMRRGEAILARPVGWLGRWQRWRARNPLLARVSAALILAIIVMLGGLLIGIALITEKRDAAERNLALAQAREMELRRLLYPFTMRLAQQAWGHGEVEFADQLLAKFEPRADGTEDLRDFAWYYLRQLCQAPPPESWAGHRGDAYDLAFAPDGKELATSGHDGAVRLWDPATGKTKEVIRASSTEVNCAAYSPDGKTLATAADDGLIKLWDRATLKEKVTLRGHKSKAIAVVFSQDGKQLISGGNDGTVRIWDVATAKDVAHLEGPGNEVKALALSPDGKFIASIGWPNSKGETLFLWDLATRRCQWRSHSQTGGDCLAFSPDGRKIVFGEHRFVQLIDAVRGEALSTWEGHRDTVQSVAISLNGTLLASCGDDGRLFVRDLPSGKLRHQFVASPDRLWCATFSPNGVSLFVTTSSGAVLRFNTKAPCSSTLFTVPGLSHGIHLSPDGQTAIVDGKPGHASVWDLAQGTRLGELPEFQNFMGYTHSGRQFVLRTNDNKCRMCDTASAKPICTFAYGQIALDSTGVNGALGVPGGIRFVDVASGRIEGEIRHDVAPIAYAPDGKTLVGLTDDAKIELWDVATQKLKCSWPGAFADIRLVISPAGNTLAVSYPHGVVKLLSCDAKQRLPTLAVDSPSIGCMAFSPDGRTLATGSGNQIKLWHVATGQEMVTLVAHPESIASLAFGRDGRTLYSARISRGRATVDAWSVGPAQASSQ